jgi:hypothetical protein
MSDAERLTAIFLRLNERYDLEGGIECFTPAERVLWFLVLASAEMNINGFASIFEQFLTRDQVVEVITFLQAGEVLPAIAQTVQQVQALLDAHNFYGPDGRPQIGFYSDLPQSIQDEIEAIGEKFQAAEENIGVDPNLRRLLDE